MNMKETVYLAGGGNEHQSANFDALFLKDLQSRAISTLVYIPLALKTEQLADAERWFNNIFARENLKIETWTDLKEKSISPSEMALYVGGGNTVQLLTKIRESGFDRQLVDFFHAGGVIYGGSAGAIVLGTDIRTAPEARSVQLPSYRGLDLLNGYSVACHFAGTDEERNTYKRLRTELNTPIIAISELGGVIMEQDKIKIIDEKEVVIF